MPQLHAIVMAGGSGTRFWPASRGERPKQVLPLANGRPLIAATIDRLAGLCEPDQTWIVTNEKQVAALRQAVPEFPEDHIILEPEARDTAPCIALATATIAVRDPDAAMVVMPADHLIEPVDEFQRMIRRGVQLASDDETLVTFGVQPTRPATSFGYIECGERCDSEEPAAFCAVRFREKPVTAAARQYVDAGLLWNSGIFVWTCGGVLAAMRASNPELAACTDEMMTAIREGIDVAPAFGRSPRTSIDFAVMEGAPKIAVVRATVQWNDVGGFGELATIGTSDDADNHALLTAGATHVALESRGNIVYAEGQRTVSLFGVEDLVVVAVGDAVLVCPKERADDLKQLIEHLRAQDRSDLL